jgi:uncharacterized protein YifE (UPF0438 family)
MTIIDGFISTDKFYDDAHFPRGFRKSGDFTIAEDELLSNIGKRLLALEKGLLLPENEVEEQFVKMCKSNTQGQTKIELLWQKYKKLTMGRSFHSLH